MNQASFPISRLFREMVSFREVQRVRWPFALRAAACMATPVLIGMLLNDTASGLMAALGGFTSLYGSGRPYKIRARLLGFVALALAGAVAIGILASGSYIVSIVAITLFAMLATWICNAYRTGPPGAYMFVLVCAAGTAMPAEHLGAVNAALLVLAGGALAWGVHMAGAWFRPRGPEQDAVIAASGAVERYIAAIGKPDESALRHAAAAHLHEAWTDLSAFRRRVSRTSRLGRLRAINRELHLLFTEAMSAAAKKSRPDDGLRERAIECAGRARRIEAPDTSDPVATSPIGRPGLRDALRDAVRPGSQSRRVILRVGAAVVLTSTLGVFFELERSYWAVAAAVLVLHQGFDRSRMVQRGVERIVGTLLGLGLAFVILAWHPQGLLLVMAIFVMQFGIEMLVVRNYALAVFFITTVALLIASGGAPIPDVGGFIEARGVDTVIGCLAGFLVYWLLPPHPARQIPAELARTLEACAALLPVIGSGDITTSDARLLRRNLQTRSFKLEHALDSARAESRSERGLAESLWPAVAATQNLVYRVISTAWGLERLGPEAAKDAAGALFGDDGERRLRDALLSLAFSARHRRAPGPLPAELPAVLDETLRDVAEVLARGQETRRATEKKTPRDRGV